jgi:hypothetical protein
MVERRRYLVYEAVNNKRKEIYVAVSPRPMHETIGDYKTRLPDPIKHWKAADIQTYRSIEFDLAEEQAREFLENYVKSTIAEGWKYIK